MKLEKRIEKAKVIEKPKKLPKKPHYILLELQDDSVMKRKICQMQVSLSEYHGLKTGETYSLTLFSPNKKTWYIRKEKAEEAAKKCQSQN